MPKPPFSFAIENQTGTQNAPAGCEANAGVLVLVLYLELPLQFMETNQILRSATLVDVVGAAV
jgi:hypothetical protein